MLRLITVLLFLVPTMALGAPLVSMGGMMVEPEVIESCVEDPCLDAGLPMEAFASIPSEAPSMPAPPSAGELIKQGGEVVVAVKEAASVGGVTKIAAAISLLLFFLINVVQKVGKNFLSGNTIRVVTILAGAGAALAGYISAGLPWDQMLQLFLAGPGAIAINELIKLFRKTEQVNG